MKLAIIIPAFNEETVIGDVLKDLPKKIEGIDEIISIIIDDGSADNTYKIATKYADKAIRHLVNLGVGAATTTGFEAAKKINSDIIVTLDADGQHNPGDINRLIEPILNKRADVVIGTRMIDSKGMPAMKIYGNWFMNFLTFLIFHKWTTDSQSGMRAFNKKAIGKMCFHSMGYEICSETIGEIERHNLVLTEVPIKAIYSEYSRKTGQLWINGINILTRLIGIKMARKK